MRFPKEIFLMHPLFRFGMNKGMDKGLRRGLREGRQRGEAELVLRLLARRLGEIPETRKRAVRKLPLARIEALGVALLDFRSKTDLINWLKSNSR